MVSCCRLGRTLCKITSRDTGSCKFGVEGLLPTEEIAELHANWDEVIRSAHHRTKVLDLRYAEGGAIVLGHIIILLHLQNQSHSGLRIQKNCSLSSPASFLMGTQQNHKACSNLNFLFCMRLVAETIHRGLERNRFVTMGSESLLQEG